MEHRIARYLVILLALAHLPLAVEAGIAHYAGKEGGPPAQAIPVIFSLLSCLVLLWSRRSHVATWMGAANTFVGLLGMAFHLNALARELGHGPIDRLTLEGALSVAPPLFAPGGFVAMGLMLIALGSRRVVVEWRPPDINASDGSLARGSSAAVLGSVAPPSVRG